MASNPNFLRGGPGFAPGSPRGRADEQEPVEIVIRQPRRGLIATMFSGIGGLITMFGTLVAVLGGVVALMDRGLVPMPKAIQTMLQPSMPTPAVHADAALKDVVKTLNRMAEVQGRGLFARRKLASAGRGTEDTWRTLVLSSSKAIDQTADEALEALKRVRQIDRETVSAALTRLANAPGGNAEERAMLVARFDQWIDVQTIRRDTESLGEVHLRRRQDAP